jgi:MFS family permease
MVDASFSSARSAKLPFPAIDLPSCTNTYQYLAFTLLTAGCAAAPTIQGLVIMRFLAGAFGSSPLTIAGGILADIWPNEQRGLAMIFFSSAPLFGPSLGPVIGGFIGEAAGWRWVQGFL